MPRGFSDTEKARIRDDLLRHGREIFSLYGLKKTSIDDLTQAAGISKGAFYLFFESKEALLLEIIDHYETAYFERCLTQLRDKAGHSKAALKAFFKSTMVEWKNEAIFAHLTQEELVQLMRRLPEDKIAAAMHKDQVFFGEIVSIIGMRDHIDANMLLSLNHALFFIQLHESDFPAASFQPMLDLLMDWVAGYMVGLPPFSGDAASHG